MSHSAEFQRGRDETIAEIFDAWQCMDPAPFSDYIKAISFRSLAQAEASEPAPDAAAVIAQCREALEGIDSITRCVHLDMGGKHKHHIQHPKQHEAIEGVKSALAAIAEWEAGR